MKTILFLAAFVVLGTTALTAQERDQDRIRDQDRTKLVMVNGEMLEVRERAQLRLQDKKTLNDGTVVSPDGKYKTKDGDQLRLRNGECLDSDGIKYRNEYQYRYKVNKENNGLTEVQVQERNQNRVHYMLIEGEIFQIRNEAQRRVQQRLELADGASINPDGMYQSRDGKQLRLQDGECLNMDGEKFKNIYQHRKVMLQKNMMGNKNMMKKGVKKPAVPKKKGKKATK